MDNTEHLYNLSLDVDLNFLYICLIFELHESISIFKFWPVVFHAFKGMGVGGHQLI